MKSFPLLLSLSALFLHTSTQAQANAVDQLRTVVQERIASGQIKKDSTGWKTRLPKYPQVSFEAGGSYVWTLETSEGLIKATLNPKVAPEHTRNMIYLSELGFFDGLNFHRIIPGFMAQGGCPLGSGTGSPGYNVPLEVSREALHDKAGVLSMARSSNPNSAGSQFFITFGPTRQLDMQYSVFGQVTEGLDVVKKLEAAGNPNPSSNGVPPRKNVTITRARVDWVPPTAE